MLLELDPDNECVMGTYGRVLAISGKVEEAKNQIRKALQIAEVKKQEQLIEQVGMCYAKRKMPLDCLRRGIF